MNKNIVIVLIGLFMLLLSLRGIILGETFGIGFSRGPDRIINNEEDFYEFWFISLFGLYWGVTLIKRAIWGMHNKDKKKGNQKD